MTTISKVTTARPAGRGTLWNHSLTTARPAGRGTLWNHSLTTARSR